MRFAPVRRFALSLPEVTEEPHHHYGSFRVRGKIFVTVPPDQEHIHLFLSEQQREHALAMHPSFTEKLFGVGKAVGVRVSLAQAEPHAVKPLVRSVWEHKAPKALQQPNQAPRG